MDDVRTLERTRVAVNSDSFLLTPGEDIEAIKQRIEDAQRAGGGFVEFAAAGERTVSVLISSHSHVVITIETVQAERMDDEAAATQFEGVFDLL
ncbi:hypothetical protein [Microbacterium sp.]|uniref:hypothetical protein n=1 Tax=Microbacterium sp. TaxID=51671 RepID=UPI002811D8FD|nr:hypothetical protein [Microbacterium sp.]